MRKTVTLALVAAASAALSGCLPGQASIGPVDRGSARGLDPVGSGQKSAMQRVNELSEKYAALADKCMKLQKDNEALREENRALTASEAKARGDLAQTRNELRDANIELEALSADLAQWKENVLGWRGKIADAQAAQIEKLTRIIRLLGGETAETGGKTAAVDGAVKKDGTSNGAAG